MTSSYLAINVKKNSMFIRNRISKKSKLNDIKYELIFDSIE